MDSIKTVPLAPTFSSTWNSLWQLINGDSFKPFRFAFVGGTAGIVQLALLHTLVGLKFEDIAANAVAIGLAAEINFVASLFFTWRACRAWSQEGKGWRAAWVKFHIAISVGIGINLLTFTIVKSLMPTTLAGLTGILVASVWNFLANNRVTFKSKATITI